ncbi:hypothetical protein MHH56_23215 [Paenibacillus sp. FSL K6-3182]|uniref:hypothetical protein n=1 Tax=Paenibacillus sp. FSL K6-3182 TaxID=2921495 RepID=UPI0030CA6EE3
MIYLVSFASPEFQSYQDRLNATALQYGVDRVISYHPSDLEGTAFARNNAAILQHEKGFGLWCWKPYILLDSLSKVEEGALVLYSDADTRFTSPLYPLFAHCADNGGFAFFKTAYYLNKSWTKRDSFVLMQCDSSSYWETEQVWAGFFMFYNNEKSRSLLEEWLFYCQDYKVISNAENSSGLPNFPEFIDHRYDQSILSLLTVKYSLPVTKDMYHYFMLPDRKVTPE